MYTYTYNMKNIYFILYIEYIHTHIYIYICTNSIEFSTLSCPIIH